MDNQYVSLQIAKLRAEVAAIQNEEHIYRQMTYRSFRQKSAHEHRERRLVEIRAQLERLRG
jgi:hypothetical protein